MIEKFRSLRETITEQMNQKQAAQNGTEYRQSMILNTLRISSQQNQKAIFQSKSKLINKEPAAI